jgi:hypothetical protein
VAARHALSQVLRSWIDFLPYRWRKPVGSSSRPALAPLSRQNCLFTCGIRLDWMDDRRAHADWFSSANTNVVPRFGLERSRIVLHKIAPRLACGGLALADSAVTAEHWTGSSLKPGRIKCEACADFVRTQEGLPFVLAQRNAFGHGARDCSRHCTRSGKARTKARCETTQYGSRQGDVSKVQRFLPWRGWQGKRSSGVRAETARPPPSDLTTLSRRHEDRYPSGYVSALLKFGKSPAAHGSEDMPVWGSRFKTLDPGRDPTRQQHVDDLVAFIGSLQVK